MSTWIMDQKPELAVGFQRVLQAYSRIKTKSSRWLVLQFHKLINTVGQDELGIERSPRCASDASQ